MKLFLKDVFKKAWVDSTMNKWCTHWSCSCKVQVLNWCKVCIL